MSSWAPEVAIASGTTFETTTIVWLAGAASVPRGVRRDPDYPDGRAILAFAQLD